MSGTWKPSIAPCNVWYWSTGEFPNGWSAQVSDDSQASAPRQRTRYTANACCPWWIVSCPQYFDTLQDAKAAAVALAEIQRPASGDPSCRVEAAIMIQLPVGIPTGGGVLACGHPVGDWVTNTAAGLSYCPHCVKADATGGIPIRFESDDKRGMSKETK